VIAVTLSFTLSFVIAVVGGSFGRWRMRSYEAVIRERARAESTVPLTPVYKGLQRTNSPCKTDASRSAGSRRRSLACDAIDGTRANAGHPSTVAGILRPMLAPFGHVRSAHHAKRTDAVDLAIEIVRAAHPRGVCGSPAGTTRE
jgi:hypothetical protein